MLFLRLKGKGARLRMTDEKKKRLLEGIKSQDKKYNFPTKPKQKDKKKES